MSNVSSMLLFPLFFTVGVHVNVRGFTWFMVPSPFFPVYVNPSGVVIVTLGLYRVRFLLLIIAFSLNSSLLYPPVIFCSFIP